MGVVSAKKSNCHLLIAKKKGETDYFFLFFDREKKKQNEKITKKKMLEALEMESKDLSECYLVVNYTDQYKKKHADYFKRVPGHRMLYPPLYNFLDSAEEVLPIKFAPHVVSQEEFQEWIDWEITNKTTFISSTARSKRHRHGLFYRLHANKEIRKELGMKNTLYYEGTPDTFRKVRRMYIDALWRYHKKRKEWMLPLFLRIYAMPIKVAIFLFAFFSGMAFFIYCLLKDDSQLSKEEEEEEEEKKV